MGEGVQVLVGDGTGTGKATTWTKGDIWVQGYTAGLRVGLRFFHS